MMNPRRRNDEWPLVELATRYDDLFDLYVKQRTELAELTIRYDHLLEVHVRRGAELSELEEKMDVWR